MYGSEWDWLNEKKKIKMNVTEMRTLKRICGVTDRRKLGMIKRKVWE